MITVTNHVPAHSAPQVVVTDKLPYEVAFRSINVSSSLGPSSSSISGDLIYVRFEEIPPSSIGFITIGVTAPTEAPTTRYNNAKIRYGNDPNPGNNRGDYQHLCAPLGIRLTGCDCRSAGQRGFREPSSPVSLRLPELPKRIEKALPSVHFAFGLKSQPVNLNPMKAA